MTRKLICLKDGRDSWTSVYLAVPDDLPLVDILAQFAEALGPDNEPYGQHFYNDHADRLKKAMQVCGWDTEPVETVILSDLMTNVPKAPSCGPWHISLDSQASLLRLVDYLRSIV